MSDLRRQKQQQKNGNGNTKVKKKFNVEIAIYIVLAVIIIGTVVAIPLAMGFRTASAGGNTTPVTSPDCCD